MYIVLVKVERSIKMREVVEILSTRKDTLNEEEQKLV